MSEYVARMLYRDRETCIVRSVADEAAAVAEGFGREVPACWWASYDPAQPPPMPPAETVAVVVTPQPKKKGRP